MTTCEHGNLKRQCALCELTQERDELRRENQRLRLAVCNQAGDNLCWLDDEQLGAIPPKAEFLKSCERYHAQIAGERGETGILAGCMTIAQLEASGGRCDMPNPTAAAKRAADAIERLVISPLHGGLPASALNCIAAIIDAEIRPLVEALERIHEGACRTAQDSKCWDDDRYCLADVIITSSAALSRFERGSVKKTAKKPKAESRKQCFRCDGTGLICDICGESENACECDPDDERRGFGDCPDCDGTGK